jgi:hypothetical protein
VPGEAQEESLLRRQSSRIKPNQTKSNRLEANAEGLMIKDESRKNQAMPQPDSQTQSGPVKPAGAAWAGGFYNRERHTSSCGCATFGPSRRYILVGRESNRVKPGQTREGGPGLATKKDAENGLTPQPFVVTKSASYIM